MARTPFFQKSGSFFKVDAELGIAYGWAMVCTENGVPYYDLAGDYIPEDAMTAALADFAKHSRVGKEQHAGGQTGEHVFVYPMTKAVASGLGVTTTKTGAIVGYQPADKADLTKIADGSMTGFSIGGFLLESDDGDETAKALAKDAGGVIAKRRVFRTFKINEISLVDRPCQEGALVGVVKAAPRVIAKADSDAIVLTSEADGHQHVVWTDYLGEASYDCTTYDYSDGADKNHGDTHNHKVVVKDGKIVLTANAGHTHTVETPAGFIPYVPSPAPASATATATGVEVVNLSAPRATEKNLLPVAPSRSFEPVQPMESNMTEAEIAALNARVDRAEKMATLSDVQKNYFGRLLQKSQQDGFLAKSPLDRQTEVDGAVVYKSADGTQFFTYDDARLIDQVKKNDKLAERLDASEIEKRAAQHVTLAKAHAGNLAGEDPTLVALVAAVESITDPELKKKVYATIDSGNAAAGMLAQAQGHNRVTEVEKSSQDTYYAKRDAYAKSANIPLSTEVDKARATREFNRTPEGAAAYAAYNSAKPTTVAIA